MAKVEEEAPARSDKGRREAGQRQSRLADALRENLRKRKAQQRARSPGKERQIPAADGKA